MAVLISPNDTHTDVWCSSCGHELTVGATVPARVIARAGRDHEHDCLTAGSYSDCAASRALAG